MPSPIIQVSAPGPPGETGPAGAGYKATSATSVAVGTGAKTWTTQAGLAYSTGARVRAYSTGSAAFCEGVVTSYNTSTGALAVSVDRTSGAGSHSDWAINLAGDKGDTGAAGVGYTARGAWSSGTTYDQGDQVSYSGQLYYALQSANTNHQPDTSPTWWVVAASGGTPATPTWNSLPAAQDGWGYVNSSLFGADYADIDGRYVRLRAQLYGGTQTNGTVLFTMPAGTRPAKRLRLLCSIATVTAVAGGIGTLEIDSSGDVSIHGIVGISGPYININLEYPLF